MPPANTGRSTSLIKYRHVLTERSYSTSRGLFLGYSSLWKMLRNVMHPKLIPIEEIPPVKSSIILQLQSLWLDARLAGLIIDIVCINLLKSSGIRMTYRK